MITISILASIGIFIIAFASAQVARQVGDENEQATGDLRATYAKQLISEEYRAQPLESIIWLASCDGPWFHSKPRYNPRWFVSVPVGREREAAQLVNRYENRN